MAKIKVKFNEEQPKKIHICAKPELGIKFRHFQQVGGGGSDEPIFVIYADVDLETGQLKIKSPDYYKDIIDYYNTNKRYPFVKAQASVDIKALKIKQPKLLKQATKITNDVAIFEFNANVFQYRKETLGIIFSSTEFNDSIFVIVEMNENEQAGVFGQNEFLTDSSERVIKWEINKERNVVILYNEKKETVEIPLGGGGGGGTPEYVSTAIYDFSTERLNITSKPYFNEITSYYNQYKKFPISKLVVSMDAAKLKATTSEKYAALRKLVADKDLQPNELIEMEFEANGFQLRGKELRLAYFVSDNYYTTLVSVISGYVVMSGDIQGGELIFNQLLNRNTERVVGWIKDEINNTVIFSNQKGETIIIPLSSGQGEKPYPFIDLAKVSDYLYETNYAVIDYDAGKNAKLANFNFACSILKKANIIGRNFDFYYNNVVEFVVRTKANHGRFATLGVASAKKELVKEFVESGDYTNDLYKSIPFSIVDGFNEKGLFCGVNLIVLGDYPAQPTIPAIEKRESIPATMLVRYIIDNFSSAYDALQYIRKYVEITPSKDLQELGYDAHFVISDKNTSIVLEFKGSEIVYTYSDVLTNFKLDGVMLNTDGTVYTPATQDADHDAIKTNKIEQYGMGLERWNLIKTHYDLLLNKQDITDFMKYELDYRKTYNTFKEPANPFWHTEYVGKTQLGDLTVISDPKDFTSIINRAGAYFADRSRDAIPEKMTWHTVHSSIYDLDELSLIVSDSTEDGVNHIFTLEKYFTKTESDERYEKKGEGGGTPEFVSQAKYDFQSGELTFGTPSYFNDIYKYFTDKNKFPVSKLLVSMDANKLKASKDKKYDTLKKLVAKKELKENEIITLEFEAVGFELVGKELRLAYLVSDGYSATMLSAIFGYVVMGPDAIYGELLFNQLLNRDANRVVGWILDSKNNAVIFENEKGETVSIPLGGGGSGAESITIKVDDDLDIFSGTISKDDLVKLLASESNYIKTSDKNNVYKFVREYAGELYYENNYNNSNLIIYHRSIIINKESGEFEGYCDRTYYNTIEFIALTDNAKLGFNIWDGTSPRLKYSFDELEWFEWNGTPISVEKGKSLFVVNQKEQLGITFTTEGDFNVKGDIKHLLNGCRNQPAQIKNTFLNANIVDASGLKISYNKVINYGLESLFEGCTKLTTTPKLTPIILGDYAYHTMFKNCTSLASMNGTLPCRNLPNGAYWYMFENCTNLTTAPVIEAESIGERGCYAMFINCENLLNVNDMFNATSVGESGCYFMFKGCKSLRSMPDMPMMKLGDRCYGSMFSGCENLQIYKQLPATELKSYCYTSMFENTSKAGTALIPNNLLPATVMADHCYYSMFYQSGISDMPSLPATELAESCYEGMFWSSKVNNNKGLVLPATTLAKSCYKSMFYLCDALISSPVIMANDISAEGCMEGMFMGCANLRAITVYFTEWNDTATKNWVATVKSTGNEVFYCLPSLPDERGFNRIPTGWTVSYLPLTK